MILSTDSFTGAGIALELTNSALVKFESLTKAKARIDWIPRLLVADSVSDLICACADWTCWSSMTCSLIDSAIFVDWRYCRSKKDRTGKSQKGYIISPICREATAEAIYVKIM